MSPDGRWLAYRSNESGRDEIYVRPFPAVNTGRWQISTEGGAKPRWSRDGRELFYYVGQGVTMRALMAVPIKPGPSFAAGAPSMLFQGIYLAPQDGRQVYDISPDGKRFLTIKPAEESASPRIIVVQNWTEELKRLVPTK